MKRIHNSLKRQLKQHFGGLDSIPKEWQAFVDTVNDAYWESDRNRIALEDTLKSTTENLTYASSELHALFQVLPDLFLILDSENVILECQCRTGIDSHIVQEDYRGRRIDDVSIDQVSNELREAIHQVRNTKSIVRVEYATSLQKRMNFYEARLLPLPGNRVIAVVRNTTEHKWAELEIQNLQRYNRGLIETSLDPLVTFNQKGMILDVNEATIQATGRNREELIGTPFANYFTDPEKARKGAMMVFKKGEVRDYELVMKGQDGTETTVAYNASLYRDQTGEVIAAFAAARDITERKHTEERLAHLVLILRTIRDIDELIVREKDRDRLLKKSCIIFNSNRGFHNTWIALLDESGKLVAAAESGLGRKFSSMKEWLKRGELTSCAQKALLQSEVVATENPSSACSDCPLAKTYTGRGGLTVRLEYRGKVYGLMSTSVPAKYVLDNEEHVLFKEVAGDLAFALRSIELETERKRTELEIQNLQRYNRGLIETSLDPLVTFNKKGIILDVNEATIQATGRNREELIGTPFANYFTDPEKARKGAMMVFKKGEVRDYELVMKGQDGTETTVAYNASLYRDQTEEVIAAFAAARDITDLKRSEAEVRLERDRVKVSIQKLVNMQDKLIRSERFAAIGEAASYLSHEIRNPLMVIGGLAGLIEESLSDDDANRVNLEIIQREIKRLESMLTNVTDFARPSRLKKGILDINSAIKNAMTLMENDLRNKKINCEQSLDGDLPSISFDPEQIKQVLINLLKNAAEAMPNGGKLAISSWREDGYVKVSFTDSGTGMSAEIAQKVFNPFFTTKKKGTGLGLAVSRRIMEDHGGEISLQSKKGKGTRAVISLPIHAEENASN